MLRDERQWTFQEERGWLFEGERSMLRDERQWSFQEERGGSRMDDVERLRQMVQQLREQPEKLLQ